MKSFSFFIAAFLVASIMMTACKSEGSKTTTPNASNTSATPSIATTTVAKPEMYLYAIRYDALQLREKPELTAKALTKLNTGEFVEGTDERSANKVTATLGGIEWTEPFLRVKGLTPEEHEGWIFGGGLTPVYAGPRANSPDLGKLTQLATKLKGLNAKQLQSGKAAWDYVNTNFSGTKGALADAAYILLSQFMSRIEQEGELYKLTENTNWKQDDWQKIIDGKYDMKSSAATQSLDASGFRLDAAEGMVYPIPDARKFEAFFGNQVTAPMQQYLRQSTKEQLQRESEDGGLIIPLQEVADRAAFWEKFNKENPYFPLLDTKDNDHWMSTILISGMNNTPVFSYEEPKNITPEAKAAYEYILKTYPGTDLGKLIQSFSTLCAAEGWKQTAKVEAFQTEFANRQ